MTRNIPLEKGDDGGPVIVACRWVSLSNSSRPLDIDDDADVEGVGAG